MSLWEVRRGATRVVILTKNYALKVPTFESWELFLCGLLSNMSEVVWNVIECENLCPVIWSIPGGFQVLTRLLGTSFQIGRAHV